MPGLTDLLITMECISANPRKDKGLTQIIFIIISNNTEIEIDLFMGRFESVGKNYPIDASIEKPQTLA